MGHIFEQVARDIKTGDVPGHKIKACFNDNLAIFQPDFLVEGASSIGSYHFVIPSAPMPELAVDNKLYTVCEHKIFSTNPGQCLCNATAVQVKPYVALFIDKAYLQNIVRLSCGPSEIVFNNGCSPVSYNLSYLLRLFTVEASQKQTGYKLILDNIADQISVLLIRELQNNLSLGHVERNYTDNRNINQAVEYLLECFHEDISLQELSRIANLSPYHFIRVFKEHMGQTPYQFLLDIKIKRAMELLKGSNLSITEISSRCGFASPSYFAVVFKKKTGVAPSYYRKDVVN